MRIHHALRAAAGQQQGSTAETYAELVAADGAVHHWRLGEPSGSTAAVDSIGGLDLTWLTTPTFEVSGALANDADTAVSLSDDDAEASVSNFRATDNQGAVEFWVKTTSSDVPMYFFGLYGSDSRDNKAVFMVSDGYFIGQFKNAGTIQSSWDGSFRVNDGSWHLIQFVSDGSAYKLFVDGVEDSGLSVSGTDGYWFADLTSSNFGTLCLGRDTYLNRFPYYGSLDEIAYYDVALSAIEASSHYNMGTGA